MWGLMVTISRQYAEALIQCLAQKHVAAVTGRRCLWEWLGVPWIQQRGRSAEALQAWQALLWQAQQQPLPQPQPWQAAELSLWRTPPCASLGAAPSLSSAPHPPMRQTCRVSHTKV